MFLYDANETMKMLGKQYPCKLLCEGGIAAEDFENMLDAYRKEETYTRFEIAMNAFMLGYIYGKRAERERRKKYNGQFTDFKK